MNQLGGFVAIKVRIVHKLQSLHVATIVVFYMTWKGLHYVFSRPDAVQSSLLNFGQMNCPWLFDIT